MSTTGLELGMEYPYDEELKITEQIAKITLQASAFAAMQTTGGTWPARRLPHPKSHGCVTATFSIVSSLREDLRVGVFQPGAIYPAKIRFSNGDPKQQSDHVPDVRGMAIKLLLRNPFETGQEAEGAGEQDFLLASDKAFFSRNAQDYWEFTESLTHFNGTRSHFEKHKDLAAIYVRSQILIENPLKQDYYSQVPYKLGKRAVKYAVRPASDIPSLPHDDDPHFLRKALAASLQGKEAVFDFLVQVQTDPEAMPVENATVIWPENGPGGSAFVKVATITIPPQAIGDCEKLSFNPWHALSEHQPLGIINRIRKAIYDKAAAIRLKVKTQDLFTVRMTLKDPVNGVRELGKVLQENGLVNAFALQRLGFVHSARFHVLEDDFGGTKVTRFFIVTTFDFDFDDYVQIFIDELGEVFDQLLVLMEDAPPTPVKQNRELFIQYVNSIRMKPALFYAAYPDLSVQNVLRMEEKNG